MAHKLTQKDIDFVAKVHACSQGNLNAFEYASNLNSLMEEYIIIPCDFFLYSNGSWFNSNKQAIDEHVLLKPELYTNNMQVTREHTAFLIESYMSKIVLYCNSDCLLDTKIYNIQIASTIIRNTLEKISRNQLANNFKHQIQHLKEKLHEAQLERQKSLEQVSQMALELKNPLTSIQGYTEIIKAALPTTNEVLRSIHYYTDLVLSNTSNIVNNINSLLKFDEVISNPHPYNFPHLYKYENLTAIVADSWQDNATLLKIILGTIGINCFSANTQEAVFNLAQIHKPDLILLDETLDKNNGIQTVLRLRDSKVNSIIIALSATFKKQQAKLYLESGFNEILTKPLDKELLFDIIEKYFNAKNVYTGKNKAEIEMLETIEHNQINTSPESIVASNIFLKNISFNISSLTKAQVMHDFITMKKIANIIKRTSGSIGLLDMSSYADALYKAIEANDNNNINHNLNLLLKEMKDILNKQESKQTS